MILKVGNIVQFKNKQIMKHLTEKESKTLKSKLPPGHIEKIKEKLKENGHEYSSRYIRMTISGERMNEHIMDAIIEVIQDHKKQIEEFKEKIENA